METNNTQPTTTRPPQEGAPERSKARPRAKKERGVKTLLRVLFSLLIVALGIFLVLFIVSKAAHYDSIGAMLRHMWGEWLYMWNNRS